MNLEVRILNELRARFSEVRILRSLARLVLDGRCLQGCEVGREGLDEQNPRLLSANTGENSIDVFIH
jgi:hypothetical protein